MNKASTVMLIIFFLIIITIPAASGAQAGVGAQEVDASNIYPDSPMPQVSGASAIIKAAVQTPQSRRRHRLTLNGLSVTALAAGEVIDSWGTYRNMTHTRWICGNSPAFAGGYDTNVPSEISGIDDVLSVCGSGPGGQPANWAFDVTREGYFSEGGWVTRFHLAGERNFIAVEGWNIANDFGWYLVARHIAKRADWIGKCGAALNFGRGIVHLNLGIGNFIAVSHHQNPNLLDLHVPEGSHYAQPRWWGSRR